MRQLGKPADARPYAERALRIAEREFGLDHPQALGPANNLGLVLYQLGKTAEARPYAERALAITENAYGLDHPHAALLRDNLASIRREIS